MAFENIRWRCLLRLCFLAGLVVFASHSDAMGRGSDLYGSGAPRFKWVDGVYRWAYNPMGEPDWLAGAGEEYARQASQLWEECGLKMEYLGRSNEPQGLKDGINTFGWSGDLVGAGLRGLTYVRSAGGAGLEADIVINSKNPQLKRLPLLMKVMKHEFGHAIGLTHSTNCTDLMSVGGECREFEAHRVPQTLGGGDRAVCRGLYDPNPGLPP